MAESLHLETELPASPERIYTAWLSGEEHGAFTGAPATCDPVVGGAFTAWDNYIDGRNLGLEPFQRIVQTWRTTEFPEGSEDSRIEVRLEAVPVGTHLTLVHTNIPDGQSAQYDTGWQDYYFKPMREYFTP